MESINRRDLIATLLGASAATMAGCSKQQTSQVQGELLIADTDFGIRVCSRDQFRTGEKYRW